jgi:hypothetical protein
MADIQDALKPPTSCDNCRSFRVALVTNDKIYGRQYGKWPYVYHCEDCNSTVGCHPNTFIPLGLMADRQTRLLRKEAHVAFDPLWRSGLMSRSRAYQWLAEELNIEFKDCHISWLNKRQLRKTIEKATAHFAANEHVAERRKEKRNAAITRKREFEKSRIRIRKTGG